jgi:hypothetical protein
VGVVEPGNHPPAERVHHFRFGADMRSHVFVIAHDRDEAAPNGDRLGARAVGISRIDARVADNEFSGVFDGSGDQSAYWHG